MVVCVASLLLAVGCLVYLVFVPYFPSSLWLIIYIYVWKYHKEIKESLPGVVVYDCNSNTQEVEAGGLIDISLRLAWATE